MFYVFVKSTHPQNGAGVVNDFVCFRKVIDNVRLGAVVNG